MRLTTERAITYAEKNRSRFIDELAEFIRFPTVSSQPKHAGDLAGCARWLARHLVAIGMQRVQVFRTPGHPIVWAEWLGQPGRPTLLIYGHYDVQPADPLKEWHNPPFEPRVVGKDIYGRGASDDKGQLFSHIKALEAYLQTAGCLPVNVQCLFEGEEEIGSPHLAEFLNRPGAAPADAAVVSDMSIPAPDRPAITSSLRGMLALELEVSGARQDLHSGVYGGAAADPLRALCEILAGLHDAQGRVTIPGFYNSVRTISGGERGYLRKTGPSDAEILKKAAGQAGPGEAGYSLYERTTTRPSLTINGLNGGYQGPGPKAVIAARCSAKLSFRLVSDQDPDEIEQLFHQHLNRHTPTGVRCRVRALACAAPVLVRRSHPVQLAAAHSYCKGFGAQPVFLRSGGTIPVVSILQETLSIPTVLMGFGLPDDHLHGPNEKFHLPNFFRAIATSIHFQDQCGAGLGLPNGKTVEMRGNR